MCCRSLTRSLSSTRKRRSSSSRTWLKPLWPKSAQDNQSPQTIVTELQRILVAAGVGDDDSL